jgi:N4-(beta-N-acetylglucosaminyl)-L-asparaginase
LGEYLEGRVRSSKYSPNRDRMESTSAEDNLHTDTVGMICIDGAGEIAACCATSGLEFKAGGRVGDAPLVGAGVYADGAVGAAVASGEGDKMLRFCVAFLVVEEMRRGASAQAACDAAVRRVCDGDPTCQAAVCALDARTGESGAACTREGFKVVVWEEEGDLEEPRVVAVPGCSPATPWKHTCV